MYPTAGQIPCSVRILPTYCDTQNVVEFVMRMMIGILDQM